MPACRAAAKRAGQKRQRLTLRTCTAPCACPEQANNALRLPTGVRQSSVELAEAPGVAASVWACSGGSALVPGCSGVRSQWRNCPYRGSRHFARAPCNSSQASNFGPAQAPLASGAALSSANGGPTTSGAAAATNGGGGDELWSLGNEPSTACCADTPQEGLQEESDETVPQLPLAPAQLLQQWLDSADDATRRHAAGVIAAVSPRAGLEGSLIGPPQQPQQRWGGASASPPVPPFESCTHATAASLPPPPTCAGEPGHRPLALAPAAALDGAAMPAAHPTRPRAAAGRGVWQHGPP